MVYGTLPTRAMLCQFKKHTIVMLLLLEKSANKLSDKWQPLHNLERVLLLTRPSLIGCSSNISISGSLAIIPQGIFNYASNCL